MQVNITTDYAIRIVLFLLQNNDRYVPSKELSEKLGIPQSVALKLGRRLHKKGILKNSVGVDGGFCLEPGARDISIYDIFVIMEKTVMLNRCLEEDCYCSRDAADSCLVRKAYLGVQQSLENSLKSIKLKNLV